MTTPSRVDWIRGRSSTRREGTILDQIPPHVSIEEAARILEVPRHVVDQLIGVGHIPVLYAGSRRPPEPEPVFYTRRQAADILQVSEGTLDKAIESGIIPVVKLSERGVRISARALGDLVVTGTIEPEDLDDEA